MSGAGIASFNTSSVALDGLMLSDTTVSFPPSLRVIPPPVPCPPVFDVLEEVAVALPPKLPVLVDPAAAEVAFPLLAPHAATTAARATGTRTELMAVVRRKKCMLPP